MDELDAVAPTARASSRALRERVGVAIEADDARRAGFEQRARVAAEADRAVDEQPAALGRRKLQDFGGHDGDVLGAPSNAELRQRARVVVGVRVALQLGEEAIVVPDVEVVELAEHVDVAGHRRGVAQARGDEHAALRVELAVWPK